MNRSNQLLIVLCLLATATALPAQTTMEARVGPEQIEAAARPVELPPYDVLLQSYGPFVDQTDPTGWAMKVRSVTSGDFKFWRGTKDLFYHWSQTNCADWMQQQQAMVPVHGDLHPGNIGTYFTGNVSTLAFGMIDFDDASVLPFQLELLGGMVTYELIAGEQKFELTDADRQKLVDTICDTYFAALADDRVLGEVLAGNPVVSKMLGRLAKQDHAKELDTFTVDGKFRPYAGKPGKPRDLLKPIDDRKPQIAAALSQAMLDAPQFGAVVKYNTAAQFEKAIKGVVLRTRIDSSGSQGVEKIFVLIDRPIVGMDHDVIFYLKQQLPSAAMRVGLIENGLPGPDVSPGKRTFQLMRQMNMPLPLFSSFADIAGKSYWVSIKEPWTDALDSGDVKDVGSMLEQARLWATVAARSHSGPSSGSNSGSNGGSHGDSNGGGNPKLDKANFDTPELRRQLLERSLAYAAYSRGAFKSFVNDPRTKDQIKKANAEIERVAGKPG